MKVPDLLEKILEMERGDRFRVWGKAEIVMTGGDSERSQFDFRIETMGKARTHIDMCRYVRDYLSVDDLLGLYYGVDPERFPDKGNLVRTAVQLMFLEQEINYGDVGIRRSRYRGPRTFLAKYFRRSQDIGEDDYKAETSGWADENGVIMVPPRKHEWDKDYRLEGDAWLQGELLEEFRNKLKG